MSENNHMWTALIIFGGIYAYNTIKKDAGTIVETVSDAVNITKDTNLAYKGTNYLVGKDNFRTGTDWFFDKFNPKIKAEREAMEKAIGEPQLKKEKQPTTKPNPSTEEIEYQSTNPRAANYRAKPKEVVKATVPGLPARQYQGTWLKLQNGKWLPLTKSDKVFNVRGAYVVHHYLWKP